MSTFFRVALTAAALPVLASGCLDDTPVSPDAEAAAFQLLGGLDPGETLDLRGDDAAEVVLPGGDDGAEFLLLPYLDGSAGRSALVRIEGEPTLAASAGGEGADDAAPSGAAASRLERGPTAGRAPTGQARSGPAAPAARDDAFHERLRRWEASADLPRRGGADGGGEPERRAAPSGDDVGAAGEPSDASPRPVPSVGEFVDLRALDDEGDLCGNPRTRTGRVEAVSDRAVIVSDTANPSAFEPGELDTMAREFDELVWPVGTRYFGSPTDLDDNQRVFVFISRVVNELTPPGAQGVVVGFFFGGDLLPRSQCAASNEGEILYIIAPDPEGEAGPPVSADFVLDQGTGVVAHEFQHLINFGRRIHINQASAAETVWLNEGLSHVAEELTFYEATGLEPRRNLALEDVASDAAVLEALNRFQANNLANYFTYLVTPNAESPLGPDRIQTRGAAWAFLRYVADQQPRPDEEFFRDLVDSRSAGLANLRDALEDDTEPRDAVRTWTVSGWADDRVPGVPGFLIQPSWNFRSVLPALSQDQETFPLVARTLGPDGTLDVAIRGGTSAYVRVGVPAGEEAVVTTTASDGGPPPPDLELSVLRTE